MAIDRTILYSEMKQCSIQPRAYRSVQRFHRTNEEANFHIRVRRHDGAQLHLSTFVDAKHQACTTILATTAGLQNVNLVSPLVLDSYSLVEFDISLGMRTGRLRALAEDKSAMYAQSEIACVGRREPVPLITHNILFQRHAKAGAGRESFVQAMFRRSREGTRKYISASCDSLARAHYCVGSLLLAFKSCDI